MKKASMTIHSLTDSLESKLTSNNQIADQFVQFYTHLYNLNPNVPQMDENTRPQLIKDFQFGSHSFGTAEELELVLKQLKPRKSPGPVGLTTGYYRFIYTFIDTLKPHFLSAFNSLPSDNPPPETS